MSRLRAFVLLLTLVLPVAASAGGDICLFDADNDQTYRFAKLKIPKKPHTVVGVAGIAAGVGAVAGRPVSGALYRIGDTLYLGLVRHFDRCLIDAVLDVELDGTIAYDCNFNGFDDTTAALVLVPDCSFF